MWRHAAGRELFGYCGWEPDMVDDTCAFLPRSDVSGAGRERDGHGAGEDCSQPGECPQLTWLQLLDDKNVTGAGLAKIAAGCAHLLPYRITSSAKGDLFRAAMYAMQTPA